MDKFKLWSEVSSENKMNLKPLIDMRSWENLTDEEKKKILMHLANYGWLDRAETLARVADQLNEMYKVQTYALDFFEHGGPHYSYGTIDSCCKDIALKDFARIVRRGKTDIVIEALSLYGQDIIDNSYLKGDKSTEEDIENAYENFDNFGRAINNLFENFGINLLLTRNGFIPRQEKIIEEYILEPVIKGISGKEWRPVQSDLHDALKEYHKGTKSGYSNAITHLASTLQAFLQIKVNGKIGKGEIDALLEKGIANGNIPNDQLSKKVLKGLVSTVMEARQKSGDAHPKTEYANDKSVRLILNSVATFIQHCITQ
jgi:hypothetical protein